MHKAGIILLHIFIMFSIGWVGNVSGQSNLLKKPVSITLDTTQLDNALDLLASQCGCYFTYDSKLIQGDKKVWGVFTQHPLDLVLTTILNDSTLVFSEYRNQVIIQSESHQILSAIPAKLNSVYTNITGKVVDAVSGQPLAYASVALVESALGTVTNDKGYFRLTLPDSLAQYSITVSYIGYHNAVFSFNHLTPDTTILLKPAQVAIQEIIVRNATGQYLVEKAIENIPQNYRQKAYSFDAFYRESIKAGADYKCYNESFLDGYKPPMATTTPDTRFKLVTGRVFKSQKSNDTLLIKLSGGMDACNQLDLIHHPSDFFYPPTLSLYHYTTTDIIIWNDELVYVVEFKPVSMSSEAWYEGRLYIAQKSYALVCAEFRFLNEKLARKSGLFIARKSHTVKAKPTLTDYRIIYASQNNCYFPYHIRGSIGVNVKNRKSWFTQNYSMMYEMVYTRIDTLNIDKPTISESVKTKSVFADYLYDYTTDGYWETINIIQPEEDVMQALSKHGLTIQEEFIQIQKK